MGGINLTKHEKEFVLKQLQSGNLSGLKSLKMNHDENFHWYELRYEKVGDTPLHCAARINNTITLEYLLGNFPPLPNCKNNDDKTALHEAAQFGHYESVKLLINYGADVNVLKRADWTPLMLACTKPEACDTVQLLLDNGALVNCRNKDGWTVLHLASRIQGGHYYLEILSKFDLDFNVITNNGRSGLHVACLHGNIETVKFLLNAGINPNLIDNCGNNCLHEAVLSGDLKVVQYLLELDIIGGNCFDRNFVGFSLLHLASSEGYCDLIDFLIRKLRFNPNLIDRNGCTSMHCAARRKQVEACRILMELGGDERIKDKFGRTALDYFNFLNGNQDIRGGVIDKKKGVT